MTRKQIIAGLLTLCLAAPVAGEWGAQAATAATVNPLVGKWQGQYKAPNGFVLTDQVVLNANGVYTDLQYAFDYWAYAEGTWTAKNNVLAFTAKSCAWAGNVDHCVPGAPGSPYPKTYGDQYRLLNPNLMAIDALALKTWLIYLRVN